MAAKWNATDKIWDFSTTDVAIWMKQSVVPKYSPGVEERMFNARDKRPVVYLTTERKEKGQGENGKRDKGM